MLRSLVPLVCAALFTPFLALALAHAQPLTLDAAVQAALRQSPRLRAAELELAATEGAVRQAGAWLNPSLGVEVEDPARRETRAATVQLSQTLELGGKREARVALARRGRELAQADFDARRAEVRAAAVQAFFDALLAQERLALAEASLRIAAGGSQAAARRVLAGKVSPTEETRARVAEAQMRIELRQAQAEQRIAQQALALALGGEAPPAELRLEGRAETLPEPGDLEQRLAQAPALRRAQLEVQRAQAAFEVEATQATPDLSISLGAKRSPELGRTQPVVGIAISLPLFHRNEGAKLEALRKREAAAATASAEALRLRSEAWQAAEQLRARADEARLLQETVLPGAQSAYEAASRGFELGKFGFTEVLDAQRTWLQARTQHLTALAQAHRAAAELERLLGSHTN